jgi:hypothetical protein
LRRYFSKSAISILRGADRKITRRLFLMPPDTLRLARGNAMCRSNGLNRRARKSSMIYFDCSDKNALLAMFISSDAAKICHSHSIKSNNHPVLKEFIAGIKLSDLKSVHKNSYYFSRYSHADYCHNIRLNFAV